MLCHTPISSPLREIPNLANTFLSFLKVAGRGFSSSPPFSPLPPPSLFVLCTSKMDFSFEREEARNPFVPPEGDEEPAEADDVGGVGAEEERGFVGLGGLGCISTKHPTTSPTFHLGVKGVIFEPAYHIH